MQCTGEGAGPASLAANTLARIFDGTPGATATLATPKPRPNVAAMDTNGDRPRLSGPQGRTYRFDFAPQTLMGRIVGFALAAVTLVLAFVFSLIVFVALATIGVVAGAWLWWKTRHVRKTLREAQSRARPGEREVRGEAIVVRTDDADDDGSR